MNWSATSKWEIIPRQLPHVVIELFVRLYRTAALGDANFCVIKSFMNILNILKGVK